MAIRQKKPFKFSKWGVFSGLKIPKKWGAKIKIVAKKA
jgi:hypothetical protein